MYAVRVKCHPILLSPHVRGTVICALQNVLLAMQHVLHAVDRYVAMVLGESVATSFAAIIIVNALGRFHARTGTATIGVKVTLRNIRG